MRFSAWLSTAWEWDDIRAAALHADRTGWDTIWVPDHFMPPEGGYGSEIAGIDPELSPVHEAWTYITAIAAVTERCRVGVLVSGNTYRHPAVLAKMAASLDHVSHGRAVLGLGAGWQENEHRRYGIELGTPRQRSDWLEEAAAIVTSLFRNRRTDFSGNRYELVGAPLEPKPIQEPLPLMIGGGGERRTLRTAALYAQEWNAWATPADLDAKNRILDEHCRTIGRDPADIRRSAAAFFDVADSPEQAAEAREERGRRAGLVGTSDDIHRALTAYASVGADEIVIPNYNYGPGEYEEALDRFDAEFRPR